MKINKIIAGVILMMIGITACQDGDQFFSVERYEKLIYIISDQENNVFHGEFTLIGDDIAACPLSFAVSGTNPIEEDVSITVEKDDELFDKYNLGLFLDDSTQYAIEIPLSEYSYGSSVSIKAGVNPSSELGLLDISLKESVLSQLSPDSVYMIPVRIKDASPYPVNESKKNVLFRIYRKNKYASQKDKTSYVSASYKVNGDITSYSSISKRVFPLTDRSLRVNILTYSHSDSYTEEEIIRLSMVLTVNNDNTVSVSPYKDGPEVNLLTPSSDPDDRSYYYQNVYSEEDNAFYLYYECVDPDTGQMQEIMETLTYYTVDNTENK